MRTVIILTIKQLKRRVVQGLIEPELFYMPWGKKETPETRYGNLVVNLQTYSTYDIDNNVIVDNVYTTTKGAIVIKNNQNKIVYNSKNMKDTNRFIVRLLYGEYQIKVIRALDDKIDNIWYSVTIDKYSITKNIILSWFPVNRSVIYYKDDEELPYYFTGNYASSNVSFSNINLKGVCYCKVYENDNMIIDEPISTQVMRRMDKISTSTNHVYPPYGSDLIVNSYEPTSSLNISYYIKALNPSAETKSCSISYCETPLLLDENTYIDYDSKKAEYRGLVNNISDISYGVNSLTNQSDHSLFTSITSDSAVAAMGRYPARVVYSCVFQGKQEDTCENPKNTSGQEYATTAHFISRTNNLIAPISLSSMFEEYVKSQEYIDNGFYEYENDKFFLKNNTMVLLGYLDHQIVKNYKEEIYKDEPYCVEISEIRDKQYYEDAIKTISENKKGYDRYEFLTFNKNTHYPYSEYIKKSEIYPYFLRTNEPLRQKYVNLKYMQHEIVGKRSEYTIKNEVDFTQYTKYYFVAYTNYSDDYDQY